MNVKETLGAFVLGVVSIVAMHTLYVEVGAQADDDAIVAAVNEEGRMRLIDPESEPGPGERKVLLRPPEYEPECQAKLNADVAGLRNRIAVLEANTNEGTNEKATAPFEVVNEAGTVVFSVVEQDGDLPMLTRFFDDTGARTAMIAARSGGGEVSVFSARPSASPGQTTSGVETTISAWGDYADLSVTVNSGVRFRAGRRPKGNYALSMFNAGGKLVAGMGETEYGAGTALIFDASGKTRVAAHTDTADGPGFLQVFNGGTLPVATLSGKGAAHSGLLQLTNQTGDPMVNVEIFPSGIGAVRAGPSTFQHGLMFLPLPGSYIQGRQ
jgi:hypothetical protein